MAQNAICSGASSKAEIPVHPRTLVLGLGNDLLADDAIGLRVVREARRCSPKSESLCFSETAEMGLALLDLTSGFERVIIVDAIQSAAAPAGFVHELQLEDLRCLPTFSPHFLGIPEVLALGRELGFPMPQRVKIFAVEVADPFTVSTQMTPAVEAALPGIVEIILAAASNCTPSPDNLIPRAS